eukprot:TRINITY_DN3266_c0_g1_i1.p1 TRINITY_DN3266_c0_g1~~TRINITY_DN3266_c0_g1_i1.p1  ORF type:complete len:396 (+),score=112.65 TRINITY_DN3266_c0_g1_i1:149-1336(+)
MTDTASPTASKYGGAEKCTACAKTVYVAEKIVVEDKDDRKTFHKNCLKCSHCQKVLSLGNYASMNGVFYCKPHFKQLFATKGNYSEGFGVDKPTAKWSPQAISTPTSFVPVDKDEPSSSKKDDASSSKKETPSSIASRFSTTSIGSEKCLACDKPVYATEKSVIEEKDGRKIYHKNCLKCSHCQCVVTLSNYAAMDGTVYCKPHLKQLFAAKGNYDEGFGKEKATSKWAPQASSAPTSFVPVDKDEGPREKRDSPAAVAGRFGSSDKCAVCDKTVYLTEKVVVEDKDASKTLHKACLKCSHCQKVLSLGTYASMNGVFYCKPHFKQLFATKGNYDEGFGKEKHTAKWLDKDAEASGNADVSASANNDAEASSETQTSTTNTDSHVEETQEVAAQE